MSTTQASALPADIAAQLAGLRDIHLPGEVSWWPLAPGWWALIALFLASVTLALVIRHKRRRSLKQAAIRELASLSDKYSKEDNLQELASEVGVLIRRVALGLPEGRQHANVQGRGWVDYLSGSAGGMRQSIAQYLAIAPYAAPATSAASCTEDSAPGEDISSTAIISEADSWIRRHA